MAVKDLEGVESAKVSLNRGALILKLSEGNSVTLEQLRDIVRKKGFTPREAQVVARGRVTPAGERLLFTVAGSQEAWEMIIQVGGSLKVPEGEVTLEGTVLEREKAQERDRLEVKAVR